MSRGRLIKPLVTFRGEQKFGVGERVRITLMLGKQAHRENGTVCGISVRFPGTPNMRQIMYHVRLDKILFSSWLWVLQDKKLKRLQQEKEKAT